MDEIMDRPGPGESGADRNPYAAPLTQGTVALAAPTPVGGIPWKTFAILGIVSGVFFDVVWSFWMAIALGRTFLSILQGPGTFCGVFFGLFFGAMMAVTMRRVRTTVPIVDPSPFRAQLEVELGKLRYRLHSEQDGRWLYRPRTLLRLREFFVTAEVDRDRATLEGPRATIKAVQKRLNP